ncbi:MAG TPA: carboxyltransferase domain-containing protein, partial [Streptosporangiaceae bacterium]|nr:carboxyltransferase domain-containing protein [Streptosporangiaceae bacterium]
MITATAAGDAAVLFDTDDPPAWLAAAIEAAELPGVRDVVPGARTVLVIIELGLIALDELAATVSSLPVAQPAAGETGLVEIPVIYDGPDLADVAELAQMTVDEVIARHSGGLYEVGWLGFAPGFGYLTGLDQGLAGVPRLATPRLAVPAGSVAIAAGLAAVYPSQSPGGWRLLGRTTIRTWDVDREPAALFTPGTKVRFFPDRTSHARPTATAPRPLAEPQSTQTGPQLPSRSQAQAGRRIEVVRPGPFTTVQDLGRPGAAAIGVPPSGAADSASLVTANRLVGNPDGAAGIELTLGRAALRCFGGLRLAVAGAPAAVTLAVDAAQPELATDQVTVQIEFGSSFEVLDRGLVSIGAPTSGLRTYVAVAGGLATPTVLGSRSADVLSKLGGGALRPGDVLAVGSERRP